MYLLKDSYAFDDFGGDVKLIIEFWIPVLSSELKILISEIKSPTELPNIDLYLVDCCEDVFIWK